MGFARQIAPHRVFALQHARNAVTVGQFCKQTEIPAENHMKNQKMAFFMCFLQQNTCSGSFYDLYIASSAGNCSLQYSSGGVWTKVADVFRQFLERESETVKH